MVKFIKVQVGPDGTVVYARILLRHEHEMPVFLGNTVKVLQENNPGAVVTAEEISYKDGMPRILHEVRKWPTWREAMDTGHLVSSWDNLSN